MDPKPVERTHTPAYPTRREVLAGAASFALVSLTGGRFLFAEAAGSGEGRPIVAPIFEHGEGRGSTGCMSVAPPSFLSEEEGVQILGEELAKHGIELKPGGTMEGVLIPARTERYELVDKGDGQRETVRTIKEDPDRAKPLKLDAVDKKKNVAVQFVSQEDYFDLGGVRSGSSVTTYEFKDTAERVAAAAKKQGKEGVFLGVFYEPVNRKRPVDLEAKAAAGDALPLIQWEQEHSRNLDDCRDMLRQQAQDFAAWLKEQNAIPGGGSEASSGSGGASL